MRLGRLRANYLHELSAGGDAEWLDKHRRYARAEALVHAQDRAGVPWRDFFSGEKLRRRRALKRLSYELPGRPALRFLYQYFWRRGFLDGSTGLHSCRLLAQYEGFAAAEIRRLRRAA